MSGVALRVTPFSIRKRSARRRPLPPPAAPIARAPAPLEKPSWEQEAADEERALLEDKDGKVIEKIEDHLLKICRQSQLPVIPDPAADVAAAAKAGRASPPVAFRLQLLPHMFCVEGLSLALPYSQDNLRFLQLIEQGRLPWDQLRAIEELRAQCEGKYVNGALYVEIDDRRQPNHGIAEHDRVRTITLHMDDDALLQDLAEAELAVVMNGETPWSVDFKIRLESLLLAAKSPAPCLFPSIAVGRLTNMLQFHRLKFNGRRLRTSNLDFVPIPLKRPRFGKASYGSWVNSQHAAGQPGGAAVSRASHGVGASGRPGAEPARKTARARKPTDRALANQPNLAESDPIMPLAPQPTGPAANGALPPPLPVGGKGGGYGGKGGGKHAGVGAKGGKAARVSGKGARAMSAAARDANGMEGDGLGGVGGSGSASAPVPGANFQLLAHLASNIASRDQKLLAVMAEKSAHAFNQTVRKSLGDSALRSRVDDEAVEARCQGLRPEALLPRNMPLPVHGTNDPLNISKTLVVPIEHRQPPNAVHELETRHELHMAPADMTGRHRLQLQVCDYIDGQPVSTDGGSPSQRTQLVFFAQGSSHAHALMRQWELTHRYEQRTRAQQQQQQQQRQQQHHHQHHQQQQQQQQQAMNGNQGGGRDRFHGGHNHSQAQAHHALATAAAAAQAGSRHGIPQQTYTPSDALSSPMGLAQAVGGMAMPMQQQRGRSPLTGLQHPRAQGAASPVALQHAQHFAPSAAAQGGGGGQYGGR